MADLVVHFVNARGTGAKNFKLKAVEFPPRASLIAQENRLQQLTTRKHFPAFTPSKPC